MKSFIPKLATIAIVTGMSIAAISQADPAADASVRKPIEKQEWFATGIGPIQASVAYGDMTKGEHGTILKIPHGFKTPTHLHTHGYRAMVIAGTIVNNEVGEAAIKLKPGSYWYQKGGVNHVTECVAKSGCMVLLMQSENFDFVPHDAAKK